MCDGTQRLVAWIDDELSEDEAAKVSQHVQACAECQRRVRVYQDVSRTFATYCEQRMQAATDRLWPVALAMTAGLAAAAAIALFFLFPRERIALLPVEHPLIGVASIPAEVIAGPRDPLQRRGRQRSVARPIPRHDIDVSAEESPIQITIPVDAVLPPGAAPDGINMFAEVSLAADGSVQRVTLHP
ncbi:MAG: hypothetical protein C5B57_11795 [Blastocatellia bacterium]|nr:MAG: hypothetical protein C5B57_11795 [Blastocatellia bacterium]